MTQRAASAATNSKSDERQAHILKAFHDCVIEQSYSGTTLADIARAADMAPSHLLYYFRGKDAILVRYFEDVANRILNRIACFKPESPERQLELLGELFFAGKTVTQSEIGLMHECFGIAAHDERMRRIKCDFDSQCKAYLSYLFEQLSGRSKRDTRDTAEVAFAVLFGLRTAVFFDDDVDLPRALALFKRTMLDLSNQT
ncbi:MAG: TetR/AcrR family transcriptional regulator [Gammaproteobacteria bacterium]|nr:TetR/AcrR family transcriptional regulator [Gammaproteobacteria bacterium]